MPHQIIEIDPAKMSREEFVQQINSLISTTPKHDLWKGVYKTQHLPPQIVQENKDYLDGNEKKIPDDVMMRYQWAFDHGIKFRVFRKVKTQDCEDAYLATQEVFRNCDESLKQEIKLSSEVKTDVFDIRPKRNGPRILTDFHIPGDCLLLVDRDKKWESERDHSQPIDEQSIFPEIEKVFASELNGKRLKKMEPVKQRIHGENDFIACHLEKPYIPDVPADEKILKGTFISNKLKENGPPWFFNVGDGGYRMEIRDVAELDKLFAAMRKERDHIYLVDTLTQQERKTPYQNMMVIGAPKLVGSAEVAAAANQGGMAIGTTESC